MDKLASLAMTGAKTSEHDNLFIVHLAATFCWLHEDYEVDENLQYCHQPINQSKGIHCIKYSD